MAQSRDKDDEPGAVRVSKVHAVGGPPEPGPAPKAIPPPPHRDADRRGDGRVTLDFSGPPLSLPNEESGEPPPSLPPDAPDEHDETPLALDLEGLEDERTSQLPMLDSSLLGEAESSVPPARSVPPVDDSPHDAWVRDKLARRSDVHAVEDLIAEATALEAAEAPVEPAPSTPTLGISSLPLEEDALGLVERRRPSSQDLDLVADMADKYALGDFTGALRVAELVLGGHPDHEEAQQTARAARVRLEELYSARVGGLQRVPVVNVPDSEVRWLGLDHRAGFLLSRIDGSHTVEQIVDVSGMARLEALKTLIELFDAGAVVFE
ncbi:MAG: hypothetical protein AAGF12_32510 [Myxococcota bacterium]